MRAYYFPSREEAHLFHALPISLWWWLRSSNAEIPEEAVLNQLCVVTATYVSLWASIVSSPVWRVTGFHVEVRLVANLTMRTIFPFELKSETTLNPKACQVCFPCHTQFSFLFLSSPKIEKPANKPVPQMSLCEINNFLSEYNFTFPCR